MPTCSGRGPAAARWAGLDTYTAELLGEGCDAAAHEEALRHEQRRTHRHSTGLERRHAEPYVLQRVRGPRLGGNGPLGYAGLHQMVPENQRSALSNTPRVIQPRLPVRSTCAACPS